MDTPTRLATPFCLILSRNVDAQACRETQAAFDTERCDGCPSPYRHCSRHRSADAVVAFPEVPYCRTCLDQELAQEPATAENGQEVCSKCRTRPVRLRALMLCLHCADETLSPEARAAAGIDDAAPVRRKRRQGEITDEMYRRAVEKTRHRTVITSKGLATAMEVGQPTAAKLLERMEEGGIVGPARKGRGRDVLSPLSPTTQETATEVSQGSPPASHVNGSSQPTMPETGSRLIVPPPPTSLSVHQLVAGSADDLGLLQMCVRSTINRLQGMDRGLDALLNPPAP